MAIQRYNEKLWFLYRNIYKTDNQYKIQIKKFVCIIKTKSLYMYPQCLTHIFVVFELFNSLLRQTQDKRVQISEDEKRCPSPYSVMILKGS